MPLINDKKIKDYMPIFIARGSKPFKIAWDSIAETKKGVNKAYPFMPKIGTTIKYSMADMIMQFLTKREATEKKENPFDLSSLETKSPSKEKILGIIAPNPIPFNEVKTKNKK